MEEVKIPISLEDGGFENGAKRILDRMEATQREVNKTGMSVDDFAKHMQEVYHRFDKLTTAVHENTAAIGNDSQSVKQLGRDLDETTEKGVAGFGRLEKAAIGFFTVQKAKEFVGKVYEVRSEIEKLETSFRILVGDKAKADALFASIRKFAVETPMQMKDLAGAAQTMMSFGIATEDVMENLKALGNVAMGDSQKFQSLALAFSQMSATGKLMGQDFLQMVNAGFNPLDQMAKTTGKSMATLKDEMSKGAISADMVRQAFIDATSEGGKFNGMLEAQSKDLAGAYSNLQGAIDDMLNDIGQHSEGIIKGAIEAATLLAKNYETVGRVLLQLIATYGSYKVAVMAVTAAEAVLNGTYTVKIRLLRAAAIAQQLLNKTMLANPFVVVATAVLSVVSALFIFRNRAEEATEAQSKLNDTFEETQGKIATEQKEIDSLFDKLRKAEEGTNEYKETKDKIIDQYGGYLKGLSEEIRSLKDVEGAYRAVASAARDAAIARGREAALSTANSDYGKTYGEYTGKIYDAVKEKAGEENAKNALRAIQADLKLYGKVQEDTERAIRRVTNNSVKTTWFGELNDAEKKLSETTERVNATFRTQSDVIKSTENEVEKLDKTYAAAETKYRNAQNLVKTIEKNRDVWTAKEYEDAVSDAKKAKEEFEKVGGDPDGKLNKKHQANAKKAAEEAKREAEAQGRMAELLDRQRRDQARKGVDLQLSTREAEIKAMSDGTDKTIRQIELDRDREIVAIKRSYEDLKIARIEEAKKMYEADPKNKGTNFYESSTFKGTNWEATYTKEEKANREALEKAVNVEADKRLKEQREKEQQYLYDYLKEYGSIEQQKEAIAREYDQKIADEGNAILREALRMQKEQALSELDFKELQQSIDWERVFGDLDRYSTSALRTLKENLRTALDAKDITVENAKVLAEKINEVDDRIISRSDAWASFLPILRERKRLTEEAVTAEQEYQRALSKSTEAQGKVMKLQQQATGILRANGNEDSDVSVSGLKRLLSTLDPASDAFTELTKIVKELEVADKALVGAISEEEKARRKQASIDSQLKNFNSIGKAFENGRNAAGGDIQYGLQQLQELPELIDAIGLHDTEFGQGVNEFVSGTSNFASAIQKFQNGDFVGAATDAIKGIQDYGHLIERVGGFSFSGSNADEVRAENNRLIAANENLTKSIDSLRGVIDKKYGRDAAEAAEKAIQQQQEKNENILKEFANEMGYHSAHHSNAYYYDIGQENADKLNEFLKGNGIDKSVRAGVWEDLMTLTPEEMKLVSEQLGDVWNAIISQGKYDRPYEILDEYIEQAGKISEINDQLVQRMTGSSADSVFDDFLSSLYDLANDSEEVFDEMADNWQKMVNKMVIDNLVGSQFQDKIKKWAEEVAKKTEAMSNGELSKTQYLADLDELQKQREGYLKEAQELMETYKSAGIIKATGNDANSDKSASSLGLDKISYEQADQIQGQLTAIQIAQGQGNATAELILLNIQTMHDMLQPGVSELRSLAITRNEYLLDIKKSSREMLETFSEKIDNVERAIKELQ